MKVCPTSGARRIHAPGRPLRGVLRRILQALRRLVARARGRGAAPSAPPTARKGRATRYRSRSGHPLASAGEVAIANWLDERGYVWEYESRVAGFTPDFMLRGERILIEYWGMKGHNRRYDAKIEEKKRRYRAAGWTLISVDRRHVGRLDERLGRKLKRPKLGSSGRR